MNNYGELEAYNLIEFWLSIPQSKREFIINYYKTSGAMFDFTEIYSGPIKYSAEHGPIHILELLIVGKDIEILNLCFTKFLEYNEENYCINSIWARERVVYYQELIDYLKSCNDRPELVKDLENAKQTNIYWKDYYFFMSTCIKEYYRYYYQKLISVDKFIECCNNIFRHVEDIIPNLKLRGLYPGRCLALEQMGIYLEKKKLYKECITLMIQGKNQGWTNDFERRITRCTNKLMKA
ncbi:MAG: hypothetical protein M3004_09785 [Bacteroidota bacterium]|nr:hypothetical protein [Bacteroidota bacterium]